MLPGDLYEQLQKHEYAGCTRGLHLLKFQNFTHPNLQSIQPDTEFILIHVAPALTDARLPFIPVKLKRDQLLLLTCH
jgi:hypothetical protein